MEWKASSSVLILDFADVDAANAYTLCVNGETTSSPVLTSKEFIPNATNTYAVAACNDGGCGPCSSKVFSVVKDGNIATALTNITNLPSTSTYFNSPRTVFITGTAKDTAYISLPSDVHLLGSPTRPTINTGILIDGKNNVTVEGLKVVNNALPVQLNCDGFSYVYGIVACKNG